MSKRKFDQTDQEAARNLIAKYGSGDALEMFEELIRQEANESAKKLFKTTVINNFEVLSKPLLASILQYLTIAELDVMSKMSRKILETVLQYRLEERRARQGQLYTFGFGGNGRLGDGNINFHSVGTPIPINIDGKKVVQVSCNTQYTAVITQQPPNPRWPIIASQCLSCNSSIDGHCSTCLTPVCYSCFDLHVETKHYK